MNRDVLRRTRKYRSRLGTIATIFGVWLALAYWFNPWALDWALERTSGWGGDLFAKISWFQPPIFAPFLLIGAASGVVAIIRRRRSALGAFYASSCAGAVARWSGLVLAGVVATSVLTILFPTSSVWETRVSPITESPIAFALLFALIARLLPASRRRTLQRALARRTSTWIFIVLLGYLIVAFATRARDVKDFERVYAGWRYMSFIFFAFSVVAAIRARRRKGSPRAILYNGASRIYFCCGCAAILSLPTFWAFLIFISRY